MIMYLDILFFKETITNFIIIYLTGKFSSHQIKLKNILMSSVVGAIFTILFLYFSITITNFLKLICATIILKIAFGFKNIYSYMSSVVIFYLITFFVGGIFLYAQINNLESFIFFPTMGALALILLKNYKKKYQIQNYLIDLKIRETHEPLRTLIDTGHTLVSSYDEPVIVLSNKQAELFNNIKQNRKEERTICYKTIQHKSVIVKGIKIKNVKIEYKETEYVNEAVLILSDVELDGYDAIIGLNFFEHATKENKIKKERKNGNIIFN